MPSLDDKFWRRVEGGGEEDKSVSSSSSCPKLYLKCNRKTGSPVLENILENYTSKQRERTLTHRVTARGLVGNKLTKHYRDDDVNKVEETSTTSESDSVSASKENVAHEERGSEDHGDGKKHKRGRRKGGRTASKDDTWSDLLSNLYNDSIDVREVSHLSLSDDLLFVAAPFHSH
jgi:hypothetical protein